MADNSLGAKTGVPVVLPNYIPQTAFTPTFNNLSTFTNNGSWWSVSGEIATIFVDISATSSASGNVAFNPSSTGIDGATDPVNYAKLGARQAVGSGAYLAATNNYVLSARYPGTTNQFTFAVNAVAGSLGNSFPAAEPVVSGGRITFMMFLPITKYAGGYNAYGAGLATSVKAGLVSYYEESSFTVYLNSSTNVNLATGTAHYIRNGKQVTLLIPTFNGTTTATSLRLSTTNNAQTWPSAITPTRQQNVIFAVNQNSVGAAALGQLDSAGVFTLAADMSGNGFGGSSVPKGALLCSVAYSLA